MHMECIIVTREKVSRFLNLQSIDVPTLDGIVEILPGHAESFFLLGRGTLSLRISEGNTKNLAVRGGQCHVNNDFVQIIL